MNKIFSRSASSPAFVRPNSEKIFNEQDRRQVLLRSDSALITADSVASRHSSIEDAVPVHIAEQSVFLVREDKDGERLHRVLEFFDDGIYIHTPSHEFGVSTLPDQADSDHGYIGISSGSGSGDPVDPLSIHKSWRLSEVVLITGIKNCFSDPGKEIVVFSWHRGSDGALVDTAFETQRCVVIESKFKFIVKQHMELVKSGDLELLPRRMIDAPCDFIQRPEGIYSYFHPFRYISDSEFTE